MEYRSVCPYCLKMMVETWNVCPSCGKRRNSDTAPHYLRPGAVLAGHYIVGHPLGRGGFSITYIGKDLTLDRIVAVKEYFPKGLAVRSDLREGYVDSIYSESGQRAFLQGKKMTLQEARTLARFTKKEGIVDVYDAFEENGTVYFIMEYLEGKSLSQYLQARKKITFEEAVNMMTPVMRSLQEIYDETGIIHCDISPGNIMLVDGKVKLIDFGAAKVAALESSEKDVVAFKSGFAPPELFFGGQHGTWTDVYALCATLYKCITGITPQDSRERLRNDQLLLPSRAGAVIDREYELIIMKGLAVDGRARYRSVLELLSAFERVRIRRQRKIQEWEKARAEQRAEVLRRKIGIKRFVRIFLITVVLVIIVTLAAALRINNAARSDQNANEGTNTPISVPSPSHDNDNNDPSDVINDLK